MNDLILITISTREPSNPESGFMATYLEQLRRRELRRMWR
jgi:hypothetical protein